MKKYLSQTIFLFFVIQMVGSLMFAIQADSFDSIKSDIQKAIDVHDAQSLYTLLSRIQDKSFLSSIFALHDSKGRGETIYSVAVRKGDELLFNFLMNHHVSINEVDSNGCTLLHQAIMANQKVMALKLLDAGIAVNVTDKNGITPLHVAAFLSDVDLVACLLDAGCSIEACDPYGNTPLLIAAVTGNIKNVRLLVERDAYCLVKNRCNQSLAHAAGVSGYLDLLQLALVNGLSIDEPDTQGFTPLHHAALNGSDEVVQYLLQNNVDVNQKTNNGETALFLSIVYGTFAYSQRDSVEKNKKYTAIVAHLLNARVSVQEVNSKGETVLHAAVQNGNLPLIKQLIAAGVPLNVQDKKGETALHVAAKNICLYKNALAQEVYDFLIASGLDQTLVSQDKKTAAEWLGPLKDVQETELGMKYNRPFFLGLIGIGLCSKALWDARFSSKPPLKGPFGFWGLVFMLMSGISYCTQ